jgi:hypothetical protein
VESIDGDFQGWMVWRMCYREIWCSSCVRQRLRGAYICSLSIEKCLQLCSTNSVCSSTFPLSGDGVGARLVAMALCLSKGEQQRKDAT